MSRGVEEDSRSVHNRLLSIIHDSSIFLNDVVCSFRRQHCTDFPCNTTLDGKEVQGEWNNCTKQWPVFANERCGSWYAYPFISEQQENQNGSSTHFKSTDGHVHIYNFSLRRLNFDFLNSVMNASQNNGAVLLVDASKYKIQPDSFSATLPVWCSVLNHLVTIYKEIENGVNVPNDRTSSEDSGKPTGCSCSIEDNADIRWATSLFTPPCISEQEREEMKSVIPDRVRSVIESKVILDRKSFLDTMKKPLRCFWVENSDNYEKNLEKICSDVRKAQTEYMCIVCISCSDPKKSRMDDGYISGAGDDEELWANGLTPSLLWENRDEILCNTDSESVLSAIDSLVKQAKCANEEWFRTRTAIAPTSRTHVNDGGKIRPCFTSYFDIIGNTGISIGTRRSGRPPDCWEHFDAIVNVTTMEYPGMSSTENNAIPDGKYYLQLPVKEGKRDRLELEKWMAIAMLFIGVHAASHHRRVLIHCAQGMDRSVAIAMAAICIYFPQVLSTEDSSNVMDEDDELCASSITNTWASNLGYASLTDFVFQQNLDMDMKCISKEGSNYRSSGIPQMLVDSCMGRDGRDLLLSFIGHLQKQDNDIEENNSQFGYNPDTKVFATKESLRLALIFIHQFRPKACPTRSTMQKLNRFFMSGLYEPS